jgi:hypothetical protein
MHVTLIATGFEKEKKSYEYRKAVAEKQVQSTPTPEQKASQQAVSEDEINNIIAMLNSSRRSDD